MRKTTLATKRRRTDGGAYMYGEQAGHGRRASEEEEEVFTFVNFC